MTEEIKEKTNQPPYQYLLTGDFCKDGSDITIVEVVDEEQKLVKIRGLSYNDSIFEVFYPKWISISLRGYIKRAEVPDSLRFFMGNAKLAKVEFIPENGGIIFHEV